MNHVITSNATSNCDLLFIYLFPIFAEMNGVFQLFKESKFSLMPKPTLNKQALKPKMFQLSLVASKKFTFLIGYL